MQQFENTWVRKLTRLRVDRAKGIAPHKPLLLLILIEMINQGELQSPTVKLTPQLAFRFSEYWRIVAHRRSQRPEVRLPLHYLRSDKIWKTFKNDGSPSDNWKTTSLVVFDEHFWELLQHADFRAFAQRLMINEYFDLNEQVGLYELVGLEGSSSEEFELEVDSSVREWREAGRSVRFRLDIVAAYGYTCALTGYRITTLSGSAIVDAAHIHQFAKSRNDDPRNGLALCKNAHWMFDQGLWSLDDEYRVIVATAAYDEDPGDQKSLLSYQGQRINLPKNIAYWPDLKHIAWHRQHKFFAQ